MLKIKKLLKNIVLVGAMSSTVFLLSTASVYAAPPPLEPGCYNNTSGDFVSTDCTTEGQARSIVAPLNRCFVITASNGRQGATVNREVSCTTGAFVVTPSDDVESTPDTETACTAANGTWRTVGTAGGGVDYGGYCDVTPVADTDTANPSDNDSTPAGEPGRIASRPNDCSEENLDGSNCGIINYLNIFMNMVSGAIAIAVIGNIIYAGIQYSMAQGDPGNVGKAKTRIRNALVAFIMYVSLFGFLQWLIPGGVF
jgi:hypothetical protein